MAKAKEGGEIFFYAPGLKRYETSELSQSQPNLFLPISLTGSSCALACDHCRGVLLRGMLDVNAHGGLHRLCKKLYLGGTRGVLVTGGSDKNGRLPIGLWAQEIRKVKEELGIMVAAHTGLIDRKTAALLFAAGLDAAMMDVVGSDETIKKVLHLGARAADFERSLEALCASGIKVVPHIVIGLHQGRIEGEWKSLEIIAKYPVAAIVLVIFAPLPGTPMADAPPPALLDIARFFNAAMCSSPDRVVILGCARPAGEVKRAIDQLAVDAGLNDIAYPADGVVAYARARGLKPQFREVCCALEDEGEMT